MISAKVNVVGGWGEQFARRVNAQVRDAMEDAAEVGAREAARAAAGRRRTGTMVKMEVLPVVGTPTGWQSGFSSKAWYAHFQSSGTLGSRRRSVKASTQRRRESASGQARTAKLGASPGITPLHFFEKGRTAARKYLKERLSRL